MTAIVATSRTPDVLREVGQNIGTVNLVRVMRALGRLQAFEELVPMPEVSPYDVERLRGHVRRRASRRA